MSAHANAPSQAAPDRATAPEAMAADDGQRARVEALKRGFINHLTYTLGRDPAAATDLDRYYALAMTVRDRLVEGWIATTQTYESRNIKRAYYLSMEYLMGRALANNLVNLSVEEPVDQAMSELGLNRRFLAEFERDAGLGNGGLGRLAACFLDSMATHELPGYGYGIRYDYGIFRQEIIDGQQVEVPDNWLRDGYPWEIERPDRQVEVGFGGHVQVVHDDGRETRHWVDHDTIIGLPYDIPIAGYGTNTVNTLRLWTAKATEGFDLAVFNNGQYVKAYERRLASENIAKVLYPNDQIEEGRELRFRQQYFFVACSLSDIVRRLKAQGNGIERLADHAAIQLNDTHPAIAIAELMRILLDEENLDWETAWDLTTATFGYTNHTLMPEALETWPVRFFERLLPRHLQIVYEINHRFLRLVRTSYPDEEDRIRRMSLIGEEPERHVRMAYLSVVGSHSTNGVAELHSRLLASHLLRDFHDLWPERFNNKTNGITQRRWLRVCNPQLAELISARIGDGWMTDLSRIEALQPFADDQQFLGDLQLIKRANKVALANFVYRETGLAIDPDTMFDSQIKRLHEYKRQVLNVMHVLHRYLELKADPGRDYAPRTVIFAGKAAPGYAMAKLIIKLINDVAHVVNHDTDVAGRLRVVFLPDYRVSLAERIIPATDLSEQISTAGTEASGTGNMKFALNGALTIGTLDGANVEIRQHVGADNFFLFGLTVAEVEKLRQSGFDPAAVYRDNQDLRRVLDLLDGDFLNLGHPELYKPLHHTLLAGGDRYLNTADFQSYVAVQEQVDATYRDANRWARMCVSNIANMGHFSGDRTVGEYARDIWGIRPQPVAPRAAAFDGGAARP